MNEFIASLVFGNSLERASAMVRLTAEKSPFDWAELAEMQRMRLVQSGNFSQQWKLSAILLPKFQQRCSAGTHIALYLATSSRPDARL